MLAVEPDLKPGFVEPVREAQETFRAVLHAMAHPGCIMDAGTMLSGPEPLQQATLAIGLSLFDFDTPVWLDGTAASPTVESYFRFHTGCARTALPNCALFGIISDPAVMPLLQAFDCGTDEAPDQSTTLIIEVPGLYQNTGGIQLVGPGIKEKLSILIDGLPNGFWGERAEMNGRFPRGIDIIFTAAHRLLALPRSTKVEC